MSMPPLQRTRGGGGGLTMLDEGGNSLEEVVVEGRLLGVVADAQEDLCELREGDGGSRLDVGAHEADDPHDALHEVLVLARVWVVEGPEEHLEQLRKDGRQVRWLIPKLPVVLWG